MLQLWFYQISVKHTNHAPAFVPSRAVCTVPCGEVARHICMFTHGGSVSSEQGPESRPQEETLALSGKTICHVVGCYFRVTDGFQNALTFSAAVSFLAR